MQNEADLSAATVKFHLPEDNVDDEERYLHCHISTLSYIYTVIYLHYIYTVIYLHCIYTVIYLHCHISALYLHYIYYSTYLNHATETLLTQTCSSTDEDYSFDRLNSSDFFDAPEAVFSEPQIRGKYVL